MADGKKSGAAATAPPASGGKTVNFKELLQGKVEEAERPKRLPAGQYLATLLGHEYGASRRKKTPQVDFNWNITAVSEDVDEELLQDVKVEGKKMRGTFYLTPDAMWRLKEFFEELTGNVSGMSFAEMIEDSTGITAWLDISATPTDDGEDVYNEIVAYASAA